MIGGGRPLLPEILDQTDRVQGRRNRGGSGCLPPLHLTVSGASDRVEAKSLIFYLFSLVATQP